MFDEKCNMFVIVWVYGNNFPNSVVGPFSTIDEARALLEKWGYKRDVYPYSDDWDMDEDRLCYTNSSIPDVFIRRLHNPLHNPQCP